MKQADVLDTFARASQWYSGASWCFECVDDNLRVTISFKPHVSISKEWPLRSLDLMINAGPLKKDIDEMSRRLVDEYNRKRLQLAMQAPVGRRAGMTLAAARKVIKTCGSE